MQQCTKYEHSRSNAARATITDLGCKTRKLTFRFTRTTRLTKSRTAASKCPSGTDPGGHVSSRKDRRCIPPKTHCVATSRRSFRTTNSDSREVSRNSTELRRLRSGMGYTLTLDQKLGWSLERIITAAGGLFHASVLLLPLLQHELVELILDSPLCFLQRLLHIAANATSRTCGFLNAGLTFGCNFALAAFADRICRSA